MNILVITYWSYKEPLVQAATLPYLKIMAELCGASGKVHLLTLEKDHLKLTSEEEQRKDSELALHNIVHRGQRYHKFGFRAIVAWFSNLFRLVRYCKKHKIDALHAFGSPAATSAHVLSILTGLPYVIDSYEPHAEPMVENGSWKKNSFAHIVLRSFERMQTRRAKAVLATTDGMRDYAAKTYQHIPRVFVTRPACVDTEAFNPDRVLELKRSDLGFPEDAVICAYAGKIGGIYLKHEIFDFFLACKTQWGERFRVIMLSDVPREEMERLAKQAGISADTIYLNQVAHTEVAALLKLADFAINPVKPVPSKRYCTSIKDGEYWAMGLPVVIPAGISDDSDIIEREGIGAVLHELTPEAYTLATKQIDQLIAPSRRQAETQRITEIAHRHRGMQIAQNAYAKLYAETGVMRMPQKHFLVLIYNSYRDPLFQNLMYRYITRQSAENLHYHFDLITFEQKKYALSRRERKFERIQLGAMGIRWRPLTYHSGALMLIKKTFDFFAAVVTVIRIRWANRTDMVIAFANTSAAISLLISKLLRTKLMVYSYEPHSEFLAEFGIWSRKGWRYRILNWLEERVKREADFILTGTRHMVKAIEKEASGLVFRAPSGVDESVFIRDEDVRSRLRDQLGLNGRKVLIYVGKFGGIYYDREIAAFCRALHELDNTWYFVFITPSAKTDVVDLCKLESLAPNTYHINEAKSPREVVEWLSMADIGLTAIPPYPNQRFRSPVKVGEYLMCGLPYITCRGVSEDDEWAERFNVGVVVDAIGAATASEAHHASLQLLSEDTTTLQERCRLTGIAYRGRATVDELFDQILAKS